MKIIEMLPKVKVDSNAVLSLVYTPGVSESCKRIESNIASIFQLTNRSNSVAVLSHSYEDSLKRAIFLKETKGCDAYPLEIKPCSQDELRMVAEAIFPNFMGVDTAIIQKNAIYSPECFPTRSMERLMPDGIQIEKMEPVELRSCFGGVIKTGIAEASEIKKPVAIVSDGSAVLGLGNIGALAALPVMEGKAVLFKELGNIDAMPLCLNTEEPASVKRICFLLENSFSGINLEDIKAPECFEIEKFLIQNLRIPVFHDDQHGAAIVTLAGLYNSLKIVRKKLSNIKIVISGAGAAGQAIARLLLKAGAEDIIMYDVHGVVYRGRPENDSSLERIAALTNKFNVKGTLESALVGADVFIGVSAANILKKEWIKNMASDPIIFALANPIPEITPEDALAAGAKIAASGRSDYINQINNSLVFPGLFSGVIAADVKKIKSDIKILVAQCLADLVPDKELNPNYIIPNALDKMVAKNISACIMDYVRNLTTEHRA